MTRKTEAPQAAKTPKGTARSTKGLAAEPPALALLRAELSALAILMPGLAGLPGPEPLTEAEIEASFDNMPI